MLIDNFMDETSSAVMCWDEFGELNVIRVILKHIHVTHTGLNVTQIKTYQPFTYRHK